MIWLVAAETNLPTEITAMGALIGIVYWLVKRSDSADKERDDELAKARKDLADLNRRHASELAAANERVEVHREEKHRTINALAAARGALHMVRVAVESESCDCDGLDVVLPLIVQILDRQEAP